MANELLRLLKCTYPIIQAPMAGGGDTPELVAAVGRAGAFGCIGAAYLAPEQILDSARRVIALGAAPFGINLFAPTAQPAPMPDPDAALARLAPYYAELGIEQDAAPPPPPHFSAQHAAVLDSRAALLSLTFGLLPDGAIAALKKRGLLVAGTATTVDEARVLQDAGVDAVIAQGSEAGGHRGTFLGDFADAMIGTLALVPQVVDAVRVPVIASGGIMDGRGIAAALALGAQAVQCGTAFLACDEAGISDAYRTAILSAREDATRITSAFSGRPARGIVNRFMREIEAPGAAPVSPFPLQNALTRKLRVAAAEKGRSEFLSLWAGQGVRLARRGSAAETVARLARETREAMRKGL
jgi:nitronate monooxygenase